MYQLTYHQEREEFVLQFPWKDGMQAVLSSMEKAKPLGGATKAGELIAVAIAPTKWNLGLITKHCNPLAMTPLARRKMDDVLSLRLAGATDNKHDADPVITDWKFYRTPYRHQVVSFKYAVDNPYAALFLEMGLGKTFVAVNVLDYFRKVVGINKPALVVIPLSSFESWEREFRLCGSDAKVVSVLGSREKKLRMISEGAGDVFLVTYESLKTMLPQAQKRQWGYLILDESTKIKNPNADRSKALYALSASAERRIILTGYPVTQSYIDLFGQYKFLDPRVYGTSMHYFRAQYCVMGGWNGKNVVGYMNIKELVNKMGSRCIRFTKAECLDLPEKIYMTYRYELDTDERKAYDAMKRTLVAQFKQGDMKVLAQNALVAGLRLVQICSGYVGGVEEEGVEEKQNVTLGNSKEALLEEVLENVPETEHVVIWCRFKYNIQQVERVLDKLGWSRIVFHGGLSGQERKEAITSFQQGKYKVFIGILQAGGHGLDLTRASYMVYFSQDYSIERRMQSEDRIHRIGQKKPATYIDLVGRRTIEDSILTCLRGKKRESDILYEVAKDPEKFFDGGTPA